MPDETTGMADREGGRSIAVEPAEGAPRSAPIPSVIPTPDAVCDAPDPTGVVVWHRKHLRVDDHRALSQAVADGDAVCPLFVFDPAFYGGDGLACDARIRVLEEAVTSLDRVYAATPAQETRVKTGDTTARAEAMMAADSSDRSAETDATSTDTDSMSTGSDVTPPDTLRRPESPGMTFGYGDPVELLARFVEQGWTIVTMATPTSRYGKRRDERVRDACGDAVTFVSGDGLVRGEEWSRSNWQTHVTEWLESPQHDPAWDATETRRVTIETGVTPAAVDRHFDITPTKTQVPTGTHRAANTALCAFTDRIQSYPSAISAPQDAREGTSGLSPYLNFGLLSVRQVYQYVAEHAPSCRGASMFESRLFWNLHYNQKLVDWPGWTERAVNPAFEGQNEPHRDDDLVTAWKRGQTGFPMVDASMRCLRQTGWLNFRMRAMCASMFTHVLHQPWWIGADWYHHHLIDSDVGINYTQWQSQAGLIGKPSQRVYNPRKQVRDQDPDGEWITRWVPELADLPSQFLDQPEKTPIAVQRACGVHVGETYPRPIVDFEARREQFWTRYETRRAAAARELRRPAIAKRASFSGGYGAARAIADAHGDAAADAPDGTQLSLEAVTEETAGVDADDRSSSESEATNTASANTASANTTSANTASANAPPAGASAAGPSDPDRQVTLPTGVGRHAGDPSPDDRAAVPGGLARVESEEGVEDEERDDGEKGDDGGEQGDEGDDGSEERDDSEKSADTTADGSSGEMTRRSTGQTRVCDFE